MRLCVTYPCTSRQSQGVGTRLRRDLFLHINRLSHAELDKLGTPSLITRITYDTNQVQQSVAMAIRLLTRAPFIVIGSMVMAMTINLEMSIIFFIAAILIAVTLYLIMTKSIPIFEKMQKKLDKISLICRENLSGNRVIRAFSKQKNEKKRIDDSTEDLAKTSIRVSILSALLSLSPTSSPMLQLFSSFGLALRMSTQATECFRVTSSPCKLYDADFACMIVVANLVVLFTKASASAARLNEVFETQPSVCESTTENIEISENESTPKIEFDNVNFTYGTGDDELEDISFKIKRGQTVGLIGGTGCGKSTLVNLIPRFYDATQVL